MPPERTEASAAQIALARAAEYAETAIRPRAGEFDRDEALPREIIDGMADLGLLGARVPVEYGGLGMDALQYGELTETIGKACASARTVLTVHQSLVSETLAKLGNEEQKNRYLPALASGRLIGCFALSEPDNGSDAAAMGTRYETKGDKLILNGRKKWISLAGIADVMIVIAAEGKAISALLVETSTPGVEIWPMKGLLGNRAAHTSEIAFKNVEVPVENVLGQIGAGFSFVVNTALFHGRYSIAWAGVAIGQAALEEMTTYARTREQFGRKIGQFQLVQGMIADTVTQVHAARALCIRAGELWMADHERAIMETNIAKYFSSKAALQAASDAVQVFGGNGCWDQYPPERLFRDARILQIIEGTSQLQQVMIANYGMRKYNRPSRGRQAGGRD